MMPGDILTDFISIHAPVKGATVGIETAGVDKAISIHAPVKGATGQPLWNNLLAV